MNSSELFVSYSSYDRARLKDLVSALRRAREEVWFDDELGGGEVWWQTILERIRNCDVFVFAMSDNSLRSKACLAELRYAQALGKPVLPIQIGSVESMRVTPLAAVEAIDFRDPTVDSGIRLITAMREAEQRSAPLPSPLPEEPPVPYAYLIRAAAAVTGAEIAPAGQSELLSEIEDALREDGDDEAARRDIARLLTSLRDREDATAQTRADADRLLASLGPAARRPGTGEQRPAAGGHRPTRWLIAAAAVLAVVAAATTAVVFVTRHRSAEPAAATTTPTVSADRLTSILPGVGDLTTIMGASDMRVVDPVADVMFAVTDKMSDPDCVGLDNAATAAVYQESGWSAVRAQTLAEFGPDDPDNPLFWVQQAVVSFPSARQANAFIAKSNDRWKGCSGRVVKDTADSGETVWTFGDLSVTGRTLSQKSFREGADSACQHALAVYENTVFDAVACGPRVDDEASRIVAKMQELAKT